LPRFQNIFACCFIIKDLGPLKYFLGIEVARGNKGLFPYQHKYALEIIHEYGLLGATPTDFPIEENHKLANKHLLKDAAQYRILVGRLIYLTITWLDLVYVVHILSQFMQALRVEHMDAARQVLCYLKGTADMVFFFLPITI